MKRIITLLIAAAALTCVYATDFLTVYLKDGKATRVRLFPSDSLEALKYTRTRAEGAIGFDTLNVMLKNGDYTNLPLDKVERYEIGTNVPTLRINTDEYVEEITSKKEYLSARFNADCMGRYDDIRDAKVQIRGRGNSTWYFPKKPYRLKFDKKISLFGLKKAKSYALIANYIDDTQMRNAIAFRIGQLLDLPFTNHSIPVNVELNGIYKGLYMLTEKIGINGGSVDIDEETGILWEIDTSFDEEFRFLTPAYGLKAMVKDPDFNELAENDTTITAANRFEIWKADFVRMERAVNEGKWYEELDLNSTIDYFLIYNLTCNREIRYPKSTYFHKEKIGDKYSFGPIWDFDWAYNYEDRPDQPLFDTWRTGMDFMMEIVKTPEFQQAFSKRWKWFKTNIYPQVEAYIDYYGAMIRVAALQNGEIWPSDADAVSTGTFDTNTAKLKEWLKKRIDYIDKDPNHGFFK